MDTINYNAPDESNEFAPPPVTESEYNDVSAKIGELIRAGQKEQARALLEAEILKGIESGPLEPWTDEDWASLRQRVRRGTESKPQ